VLHPWRGVRILRPADYVALARCPFLPTKHCR
jgi:hypothetical protein